MEAAVVPFLTYGIICGIACVLVADRKSKRGPWFFYGLIFGVFALIKLVLSPSESPEKPQGPGTAHLYLGKRPQFSTPSDARRWLTDQEDARRNRVRAGGRGDGE